MANERYYFNEMKLKQTRDFPIAIHEKLRVAAHLNGKRHGRTYRVNKMKYKNGREFLRVTCMA